MPLLTILFFKKIKLILKQNTEVQQTIELPKMLDILYFLRFQVMLQILWLCTYRLKQQNEFSNLI